MKPCCQHSEEEPQEVVKKSCCSGGGKSIDWLLWISLMLVAAGLVGHFLGTGPAWWRMFSHGAASFLGQAWWGILAGILAVGIIGRLPQELVTCLLGKGGTFGGIARAVIAGTMLDLCNHGILMIGAKLYRKGASLGQTMAFLIASPWNSFSLTLMLVALIGWKWAAVFIVLSIVIALVTGLVVERLVKSGVLPGNPNARELPENFRFGPAFRETAGLLKPSGTNVKRIVVDGWKESGMILRWIFFGVVLASAIRAFVPESVFTQYFGPSMVGLLLTLLATTVIEVCSEGSSPVAADLLTRAAAPGNAFTFLMAGAATDYTEILVMKETTKSWKAALFLPLLTVPQVIVIGWLLNQ